MCFTHLSAALVPLLPGLWAICFGIGTFASRPYLPRASGWVALFYYAAGFTLLWIARGPEPLTGWWVGGTFGVGQLLAALVALVESRTDVTDHGEETDDRATNPDATPTKDSTACCTKRRGWGS